VANIGKTFYYPVWVSASGRVSLRWGKPCDAPSEAARIARVRIATGEATTGFVVEFSAGKRTPLVNYTQPPSARKIIGHWEELRESVQNPPADPEI
jgi:hypothetical protein